MCNWTLITFQVHASTRRRSADSCCRADVVLAFTKTSIHFLGSQKKGGPAFHLPMILLANSSVCYPGITVVQTMGSVCSGSAPAAHGGMQDGSWRRLDHTCEAES